MTNLVNISDFFLISVSVDEHQEDWLWKILDIPVGGCTVHCWHLLSTCHHMHFNTSTIEHIHNSTLLGQTVLLVQMQCHQWWLERKFSTKCHWKFRWALTFDANIYQECWMTGSTIVIFMTRCLPIRFLWVIWNNTNDDIQNYYHYLKMFIGTSKMRSS